MAITPSAKVEELPKVIVPDERISEVCGRRTGSGVGEPVLPSNKTSDFESNAPG